MVGFRDASRTTHRYENIRTVHQHHEKTLNASQIDNITCDHDHEGADMMDRHLDVILPSPLSLSIQD